jgi:hypothetical protein
MIWLCIFKIFLPNKFGKNGHIANDYGAIGEHLALGLE